VEAMASWRPDARPAPLNGIHAATTALAEGATTLLVDVAGPTPFALSGEELRALAEARVVNDIGPDVSELRAAVRTAVGSLAGVLNAQLILGDESQLRVTLDPSLSAEQYETVKNEITSRLREDESLARWLASGPPVRLIAPDQTSADTP